MAPTSGPYGTDEIIYDPTGVDANPIADGWTVNFTGAGHSNWKRESNLMAPSNEFAVSAQAYRGDVAYPVESEIWMAVPGKGANGTIIDLILMLSDPNGVGRDFYGLEIGAAIGTDAWDLFRQFDATPTFPLASGTAEFTAGDYAGISVRDDGGGNPIVKGWHYPLAGSAWVEVLTFTDTSGSKITVPGFMGLNAEEGSAWRVGLIFGGVIHDVAAEEPVMTRLGGRGAGRW